jgi:pectinesterase
MKNIKLLALFILFSFQTLLAQTFTTGANEKTTVLMDSIHLVVAQDGSGNFTTLQAAINAVPDYRKKRTNIFVKNGVYNEKLILPASKQLVSLIGESVDKTIITYGDWAQKKSIFGEEIESKHF